jgi:hypothetical protein
MHLYFWFFASGFGSGVLFLLTASLFIEDEDGE